MWFPMLIRPQGLDLKQKANVNVYVDINIQNLKNIGANFVVAQVLTSTFNPKRHHCGQILGLRNGPFRSGVFSGTLV